MATPTVKTTYTIDLTFGTSAAEGVGTDMTWKLDNPKSSISSFNYLVENVFTPSWFDTMQPCTASGEVFVALKKAKIVETVKTTKELD